MKILKRLTGISIVLLASAAFGANSVWDGGALSSNWMNPTNWLGDVLPPSENGIAIRYSAAAGISLDVELADTASHTLLVVGQEGSQSPSGVSLTLNSGADLSLGSYLTLGFTTTGATIPGYGKLTVNDGAVLDVGGDLTVGHLWSTEASAGSTAIMTLNGGTTTVAGVTRLASELSGTPGVSTGTMTVHTGAVFNCTGVIDVGFVGEGTLTVNGGTVSSDGALRLAVNAGSSAELELLSGEVNAFSLAILAGTTSISVDTGVLLLDANRTGYLDGTLLGTNIATMVEGGGVTAVESDAMKAQYSTDLQNEGEVWWGYDPNTGKTALWATEYVAPRATANTTWTGDGLDSDWMNPNNWQGSLLPSLTNQVSICYDDTPGVSLNVELAEFYTLEDLVVGQQGSLASNGVSLTLDSGADLSVADDVLIGFTPSAETIDGDGSMTVNSGAVFSIGDSLSVGHVWVTESAVNSAGSLTLDGGTTTVAGVIRIANKTPGGSGVSSGIMTVNTGAVFNSTSSGVLDVGYDGDGTLIVNGGTVSIVGGLRLAVSEDSVASLELLSGEVSADYLAILAGTKNITLDEGVLLLNTNRTGVYNVNLDGAGIASVIVGGGLSSVESESMKTQYSTGLNNDGNVWWGYDPVTDKTALWGEFSETTGYAGWSAGWGVDIGAATNDYDGDGLINIYEYGLGGNPTNASDLGQSPTYSVESGGFGYVFPQLAVGQNSGLTYYLETCSDLVAGTWTNAGYLIVSTNVSGGTFDTVSNLVDTTETTGFVRLVIE